MTRLPRRLLLWGGAAAVAAGGFAFMAGNTVAASSAGEGAGAVTGYTVSGITYTVPASVSGASGDSPYCYGNIQGNPFNCYVLAAEFTLTSNATAAPANGQPTSVVASLLDGNNVPITGQTNMPTTPNCKIVGSWSSTSSTAGTGTYVCTFGQTSAPYHPKVSDVQQLNVEANQ